jgi:hypothetical protein
LVATLFDEECAALGAAVDSVAPSARVIFRPVRLTEGREHGPVLEPPESLKRLIDLDKAVRFLYWVRLRLHQTFDVSFSIGAVVQAAQHVVNGPGELSYGVDCDIGFQVRVEILADGLNPFLHLRIVIEVGEEFPQIPPRLCARGLDGRIELARRLGRSFVLSQLSYRSYP